MKPSFVSLKDMVCAFKINHTPSQRAFNLLESTLNGSGVSIIYFHVAFSFLLGGVCVPGSKPKASLRQMLSCWTISFVIFYFKLSYEQLS